MLAGAVLGLFRADETEFTADNALITATSAEDGSFGFNKVPYGEHTPQAYRHIRRIRI